MIPPTLFHQKNWLQLMNQLFATGLIALSIQTFFYLNNLFLFNMLSIDWNAQDIFTKLQSKGYDFGDLLRYKYYAVATSLPVSIVIFLITIIEWSNRKGQWFNSLITCFIVIIFFRFSNHRFFYEALLVRLGVKVGAAKAWLFAFTAFLEFAIGFRIFLRSRFIF